MRSIVGWLNRFRKSATSNHQSQPPGAPRRNARKRNTRLSFEALEQRWAPAVDLLSYHNDIASTGLNSQETALSPVNVNVNSFGKLFATPVDGQLYAQPLIKTATAITAGPNTTTGVANTVFDVAYVATQHDSVYAIDAGVYGGAVLWKRSFLDTTSTYVGTTPGTNINNPLLATSITTVPNADTGTTDIAPEIGITGTPVIDAASSTMYVVAKTKEKIGGVDHYVQRLHAINIQNGTDRVQPYEIADTYNGNTNRTQIYVYGTGDGSVVDPYNGTGKKVVQFNALREHQRAALSLVNNEVYVSWASHGDNGPYHGWVVKWDVSKLGTSGLVLSGVLNTSPNSGLCGIWQAGGQLAFESDGGSFYFETGNGAGGDGNPILNAQGFPADGTYSEAMVKVTKDATSTPLAQNINGWGLKVVDYFIPYNQVDLDNIDADFGSSAPLILPDSAGIPGYPRMILGAGKQGKIYVLNRDNLGKFDPNNDLAVNSVPNGNGNNTPVVKLPGSLSTPAFYNGKIYWISAYNGRAFSFTINSSGQLVTTSQTVDSFGYLPGSPSITSNGTQSGIVWLVDRTLNALRAYDANSFSTELWNSNQKSTGTDALGATVKFAVPTIVNGQAYVGTANSFVSYGLTPPANQVPQATVLSAVALSGTAINLTWTDPSVSPNLATGYQVETSVDGVNYVPYTTAPASSNAVTIGALTPQTTYSVRVRGFNGVGNSTYSNVATVTTNNLVALIDFSAGFAGAAPSLTLTGSAAIPSNTLQVTKLSGLSAAGSAFSKSQVDITRFDTQFDFQLTAGPNTADGFAFVIQRAAPNALYSYGGGGLGYGPSPELIQPNGIPNSVAIKFDLFSNQGEGFSSTGLYTNGAAPGVTGSIDLLSKGIDLHGGNKFRVAMSYNGTTLTVVITDTVTNASASQVYNLDLPTTIGGTTAYVGFTGGTGGLGVTQEILNWTFSPNAVQAPNAPLGLGATPDTATSVALTWTSQSTNQTGYRLDRATNDQFSQNLITQVLPATPNAFTDAVSGLAPGNTYYYRLRAFNVAGDSGNSNVAVVTIPLAPALPTNATVVAATTRSLDLTWIDNASLTATSYVIFRSANRGAFTQYETLPATSAKAPSLYTWTDTQLTPGTYYSYHIQAVNSSGHNDFSGTNATTLTVAPGTPLAYGGDTRVSLYWNAPVGAVSYNVYRSTVSNGQGTVPLVTGITTNSFIDTTVENGTTYFYKITAVNANTVNVPIIDSESARSIEAAATPSSLYQAHINFSASSTQVPQGYLNDVGLGFGNRPFGLRYGWNVNNTWNMRNRDSANAPDEQRDSFGHLQSTSNPNGTWEIAVPSGVYYVNIVAGDPGFYDSVYKIDVEGVRAIDGTPRNTKRWFENSVTVSVTDGRLTISNGVGAVNNKIDSIDILQSSLVYRSGFASTQGLQLNGAAVVAGTALQLTSGTPNQSSSVFSIALQDTGKFATQFAYKPANVGDGGFAFLLQNSSPTALATAGSTSTFASIPNSVAIKFNLSADATGSANSFGVSANGVNVAPVTSLTAGGLDIRTGDTYRVNINYDGTTLKVTLVNATTNQSLSKSFKINLKTTIGSSKAYVGFAAGTSTLGSTQNILTWNYTSIY